MTSVGKLSKHCWVEELKAYRNAITNRVIALDHMIGKLEGKSSPLLDLAVAWRNKLLIILGGMNSVIGNVEKGNDLSSHIRICELKNTVYAVMMKADSEDPIYNNLKHLVAGILGILESICNK